MYIQSKLNYLHATDCPWTGARYDEGDGSDLMGDFGYRRAIRPGDDSESHIVNQGYHSGNSEGDEADGQDEDTAAPIRGSVWRLASRNTLRRAWVRFWGKIRRS
jgi:hypothetical protein